MSNLNDMRELLPGILERIKETPGYIDTNQVDREIAVVQAVSLLRIAELLESIIRGDSVPMLMTQGRK